MRTRHPDIALQVTDATGTALQGRLLASELDVAIYALPTLAADEQLSYLPLYREPFVIVVKSGHRLARQDTCALRILRASLCSDASTASYADDGLAQRGRPDCLS